VDSRSRYRGKWASDQAFRLYPNFSYIIHSHRLVSLSLIEYTSLHHFPSFLYRYSFCMHESRRRQSEPPPFTLGYTSAGSTRLRRMPSTRKETRMDKNEQEQVINILTEKGATQPCPRCQNLAFDVVGDAVLPMTKQPWILGGLQAGLPLILVACTNCGYI